MKEKWGKHWWKALLFAAAVLVLNKLINMVPELWAGLGKLIAVLAPFIGGLVIALLLGRPCAALERLCRRSRFRVFNRPARVWAIVGVYLGLIGLLALLVSVIVPLATQGVSGLLEALPAYLEHGKAFIDRMDTQDGLLAALNVDEVLGEVSAFVRRLFTAENIMGYLSGLVSITSSFITVLIAFIISIYMLAGRESLLHTLRRLGNVLLPEKVVSLAAHYAVKSVDILTRYVYSMLLDALCICVIVIPGLYISGIPYPLAFAVFIGVANLIPYFGAITSGAVAVLVLLLGGHWGMALFLAIYILVAQQLDGNVIQPRIYGQSVGLQPLYVLLAITVGGGLGGFVGMLIGVPVTAVLQMLVTDFLHHHERVKRERAAVRATDASDESAPSDPDGK